MKSRWILLIPLLLAAPAAASVIPFEAADLLDDDLDAPRDLAVGEMSGDELLDFVFCSDTGAVRYRKSLGAGVYSPLTLTSALDSPYTLALGDLDRDGDLDIVVGQYDNIPMPADPPYPPEVAEILWIRNPAVGGGGWDLFGVTYMVHEGVRKIVLGDVDGDGDLDILIASTDVSDPADPSGTVDWLRNPGDPSGGGWDGFAIDTARAEPTGLAAADIDADGDLDVVTADIHTDQVLVYKNDGTPTDGGWVTEEADDALDGARSVAIGDLEGDGTLDLVAAGGIGATIAWYEGPGAGWSRHNIATSYLGAGDVSTVDLDRDGDLDVVARAFNDGDVSWFENFDGQAGVWLERLIDGDVPGASAVEAADLDHEGDLDVIAVSMSADSVYRWKNVTIHRRFHAGDPLVVRSALAEPRAVAVADLNGDSWLDWVTALWDGDAIPAYLAVIPDANIWMDETVAAAASFDGARAVATGDINGDGKLDVIGSAVAGDDIAWWQNDGSGNPTWTRRNVYSIFDGAHRAAPADFDGDGDLDLAVVGYNADELRIALNENGAGTDWTDVPLLNINGPFDLRIGDLDRNGYPDMAVSGYDSDSLRVILDKYPDPWVIVTVASGVDVDGPRGIDLCDVDDDGDVDLVAALRLIDRIRWYENDDGIGTTWVQHDVGSGAFIDGAGVRCADVDGDADADVFAAGQSSDSVFYWLNGGTGGSWTRVQIEQSLDSPWEVDLGDLDRDGDLDLAVAAGGTTDRLLWYRNVGGQFACTAYDTRPRRCSTASAPRSSTSSSSTTAGRRLRARGPPLLPRASPTPRGTPLTSAQANALIERIEVFQRHRHEPGLRARRRHPGLDTVLTLGLTDGTLPVVLPDGDRRTRGWGRNGVRQVLRRHHRRRRLRRAVAQPDRRHAGPRGPDRGGRHQRPPPRGRARRSGRDRPHHLRRPDLRRRLRERRYLALVLDGGRLTAGVGLLRPEAPGGDAGRLGPSP